jgi:hypothetical protein
MHNSLRILIEDIPQIIFQIFFLVEIQKLENIKTPFMIILSLLSSIFSFMVLLA